MPERNQPTQVSKSSVQSSLGAIDTGWKDAGGSIPSNVIEESELAKNMLIFGNNAANDSYAQGCKQAGIKRYPARFPAALPEFFIKLLTDEGDVVLDPFAGSNTTGAVSEKLQRLWIAIDNRESYLEGSKYRFFQAM